MIVAYKVESVSYFIRKLAPYMKTKLGTAPITKGKYRNVSDNSLSLTDMIIPQSKKTVMNIISDISNTTIFNVI